MYIAYFDEFGHCGPFISRNDPRYSQSPVFGLAGFIMPHDKVRQFATFFLKLKSNMLAADVKKSGVHPATWEKKGSELITSRNILKYKHVREGILRLLNELYRCRANVVYVGREKYQAPQDSRSSGLYTTVLGTTIRAVDEICGNKDSKFMLILDQHADRMKLIESSAKTMFDTQNPARYLLEPPFQVESHMYQTIQAADWIAALVGRLQAYAVEPTQYADWEWAERIYGHRLRSLATHSSIWRPSNAQRTLKLGSTPVKQIAK